MIARLPPIRIAIIGISGYGRIHLELARESSERGEAELVAAVVINPEEEADNIEQLRLMNCAIYANIEEMFRQHAGQIDLCLIPTGIPWHAHMTIAALRAGAHVLVEKPIAASLREVAEIKEMERTTGRTVAVGFQDCYDPGTQWLIDSMRGGAIGRIQSVRFLGIWPRSKAYFERNNWAGRLSLEGVPVFDSPLNNAFAHFVMLSLLLSGSESDGDAIATKSVELFRAHAIESFDTAVVTLQNGRGVKLWFGASLASTEVVEPEIVIEGAAGTAYWRYEHEAVINHHDGRTDRRTIPDQRATRSEMMAAVLKRVRDSNAPVCTTTMAARHTEVIELIHKNAVIKSFLPESVTWSRPLDPGEIFPSVRNLDGALRRAFEAQQTLRESGISVA